MCDGARRVLWKIEMNFFCLTSKSKAVPHHSQSWLMPTCSQRQWMSASVIRTWNVTESWRFCVGIMWTYICCTQVSQIKIHAVNTLLTFSTDAAVRPQRQPSHEVWSFHSLAKQDQITNPHTCTQPFISNHILVTQRCQSICPKAPLLICSFPVSDRCPGSIIRDRQKILQPAHCKDVHQCRKGHQLFQSASLACWSDVHTAARSAGCGTGFQTARMHMETNCQSTATQQH